MYGFEPTEEQSMLVEAARRLAVEELQPAAHEADETGVLPQGLIEAGWGLGLSQVGVETEFGGLGEPSAVTTVLALEELGFGDAAAALAISAPALFVTPVSWLGTQEQKARWLPSIVEGSWQPFTAAWIEPSADFNLNTMRLVAAREDGHYRLSGLKSYVPYADQAPAMVVCAQAEDGPALFIVEAGAAGLRIGNRQQLLGLAALPLFDVEFESVEVDEAERVGAPDADLGRLRAAMGIGAAAVALGVSRAANEYSLAYAKERVAFGEPIAHKQSIAFMLAEMAIEIESIRLLTWEAAWQLDQGLDAEHSAYLAHLGATDMAMMVTDRAVQILGGHGYIRDHPVERWMRNGRGVAVMPGMVTA